MSDNDPQPTADDLARDLRADLEVCDAATPGPWGVARHGYDFGSFKCTCNITVARDASDPGKHVEDSTFTALARTALPAAIRRALAAEAEVQTLRAMVESLSARVAAQSDLLAQRAERGGDAGSC